MPCRACAGPAQPWWTSRIGRSTLEPAAGDRRFDDPAWQDNPLYRGLMHSHLALVREIHRVAGELDLSPRDEARTRMALGMVADTLAPTNTLLGNPAALRRTLDTGGRNLLDGARNLAADWRDNGGLPAMVDGTRLRRRREPRGHARLGRVSPRDAGADPVPGTDAEGARHAAVHRAAANQQVLHLGPRARPQPDRAPGAAGLPGLRGELVRSRRGTVRTGAWKTT